MKALRLITLALVIFGGLNLGLAGVARFDLILAMFGYGSVGAMVVQSLIGLAALWHLVLLISASTAPQSEPRSEAPLRHLPEV